MNKKFKKLALNTETLRNLNEKDLKNAAGGATEECTVAGSGCTRDCSMCTVVCSVCCV